MKVTRRHLQITLGALWLLDGALQLQPFMFGTGFAHDILAPAAVGQPGWVAGPVTFFADHIAAHPPLLNTAFALGQLALGVGLLIPRAARVAIPASIVWSLGIWWFGEGLGGLAGGHASLLTGAPGAVLLYAVLGAAAWPGRDHIDAHRPPARWLACVWAALWVGGTVLQLLPGQNRSGDVVAQLDDGAHSAPGWLAGLDGTVAHATSAAGEPAVLILAVAMAAVGLGALARGTVRSAAIVVGALLAALFWLLGQNLGALNTGQATDPNTGPLVLLLAFALLSTTPARRSRPAARATAPGCAPHRPAPPARVLQPLPK